MIVVPLKILQGGHASLVKVSSLEYESYLKLSAERGIF